MDPRCEGGLRGRWYESEWMRWKWAQIHLGDDELALTIALACVPQGFYSVYSSVFANLAKAEAASSKQAGSHAAFGASRVQRGFTGACDIFFARMGVAPCGTWCCTETQPEHLTAGTSSSPWSEVNAFYNHWAGFVSKRDFSWADEYDVRQAPNRKVGAAGRC